MKNTQMIVIATSLSVVVSHAALIGHWDFEDGTAANQVVGGAAFDGTLQSGALVSSAGGGAFVGSSKYLDASSGLLQINGTKAGEAGYNGAFDTATFSVSYWMKFDASGAWQKMVLKGIENGGGNWTGWCLRQYANTAGLTANIGVNNDHNVPNLAYNDGGWHHVVMTLGAGSNNLSMYLDNNLLTTTTRTPNDAKDYFLQFGGMSGQMDDIRYYDNVLSATEVNDLYSIPEPATLGLIALFGGGMLFVRRSFML